MGVLNIFGNFLKRQPDENTNYLSLTLTSDKILAVIWQLQGDSLNFLGFSHKNFHNIDSLIHETAVVIDGAAQHIKNDVSQVVFGLSYYWFESETPPKNVSRETLDILKDLSSELSLEAQAFVPLSASVNHFLKIRDSKTPNAIYIGAFKDFTEIAVLTGGIVTPKIYKGQAKKENIVNLLSGLKTELGKTLPSDFVFFSTHEDNQLAKELEKMDLKELVGGEQKVEIIESEQVAKCIAYSQAADILGHDPQFISTAGIASAPVSSATGHEEETPEVKEQDVPKEETLEEKLLDEEVPAPSPGGFDFIEDQDVLESGPAAEKLEAASLGNIKPIDPKNYAVEVDPNQMVRHETTYESPKERIEETKKSHKKNILENLVTLSYLSSLTNLFSKNGPKKLLISLAVLIIGIVIALFALSNTITAVSIILKANTSPLEDSFSITAAPDAAIDAVRERIPAQSMTATAQDTQSSQPTGTKKIGDSAKGAVNVFNWTTSEKTFPKNTVIISKDGVKFTLDADVNVASRSASTPGQSSVSVTAQSFGDNGNISAGVDFTFQQFDELLYSAKNDNAFTGGSQKQVTVVAQEDLDKLQKSLTEALTQKAKESLKSQNPNAQLADEAISINIAKKQFDKNLNDEASSVSLTMEITATALTYNQDDLKNILAQMAQSQSQDKLQATPDNIDFLDIKTKLNKTSLTLSGQYRANLVPKIDTEDIKNKIAGKSQKDARGIILSLGDISSVDFRFTPNLFLFTSIPKNTSKISIAVEANK